MKKSCLLIFSVLLLTSCLNKNFNYKTTNTSQSTKGAKNYIVASKPRILAIPKQSTLPKPLEKTTKEGHRPASYTPCLYIPEMQIITEHTQ